MTQVSIRTLDTIEQLVEGSEMQRLAQSAVAGGKYWKQRAEAAEALLREMATELAYIHSMDDSNSEVVIWCGYCDYDDPIELHAPDCVIVRARAHLAQTEVSHV